MKRVKENPVTQGKNCDPSPPVSPDELRANGYMHSISTVTVATRRQTPEEQRHWETALEIFLAELVRQQLEPSNQS